VSGGQAVRSKKKRVRVVGRDGRGDSHDPQATAGSFAGLTGT
jgi:hypothetical protein